MVEKEGLEFPVLVEEELQATHAFGILNQKSPTVPHPTVVVIDREGVVRFFHLDEDYSRRPEPQVVLDALQELSLAPP